MASPTILRTLRLDTCLQSGKRLSVCALPLRTGFSEVLAVIVIWFRADNS
jgi:hypothetical protein